jgi:putative oxidoreductase
VTSPSHDAPWQRPDQGSSRLVDPEDDLPSATYTGDFETTAIPHYNSTTGSVAGGLTTPEPLPYVQPIADLPGPTAAPAEIGPDTNREPKDRRGTQDLGLLLLRVGFGALLIVHGLQKVFGWWGGSGLDSLGDSLADAGYRHSDILTYVAAGTQITAGVLLVLGLFTPIAAAVALAYLLNGLISGVTAQADPREFRFFLPDGHEYQLILILVTVAIILVGPGRYGFDAGRGWARRPFIGSFVALLLGIGGAVAIWMLLNGGNPLA